MGYNNHHAGLHMIRYRGYGAYDDLRYYDRLALEERRIRLLEGEKNRVEEDDLTKERQAVDMENSSKEKLQKKKSVEACRMKVPQRTYGTTEIIDIEHFLLRDLITVNVMIMALKGKKDIYKILNEAESLMKEDSRTNNALTWENSISWMPMMWRASIFLSILADKLDCSIQEFFINDEDARKKFVYKFLDTVDDNEWELETEAEDENVSFRIENYDLQHGIGEMRIDYRNTMDLCLEKVIISGVPNYTLSYGSLYIYITSSYDYMRKGAYLWEEEEGKLKEIVERLIRLNS